VVLSSFSGAAEPALVESILMVPQGSEFGIEI